MATVMLNVARSGCALSVRSQPASRGSMGMMNNGVNTGKAGSLQVEKAWEEREALGWGQGLVGQARAFGGGQRAQQLEGACQRGLGKGPVQ